MRLKLGKDHDERDANLAAKDKDNYTRLLWAAANGHEAVERLLLEKGSRNVLRYRFSYN